MNSPTWMLKGLVAGPLTQKLLILSSHMALLTWSTNPGSSVVAEGRDLKTLQLPRLKSQSR
jgi:hypothetical protein